MERHSIDEKLFCSVAAVSGMAAAASSWLAIIGGIWLAVLGEIEIVVIGVICMLVGHWIIGLCLWPSIGIGLLGVKASDYSKVFGAILTFIAMLASFAVFYVWGVYAAKTMMGVFLQCGSIIPCALFGFGVAEATPQYQVDSPINLVHSATITIGYLALFIIATLGGFSIRSVDYGMMAMIVLFFIASICETVMSMNAVKEAQEYGDF